MRDELCRRITLHHGKLAHYRAMLNSLTDPVGYSRQRSKSEKMEKTMPDFNTTRTPGLPLLLCDQGSWVERGLADVLLGYFSNVDRRGLRLILRWAPYT